MHTIFLIPPSEGKRSGGDSNESVSVYFEKPHSLSQFATEKDLKCSGKRYEQGINLNKNISSGGCMLTIERYSGVMYNAIDYQNMSNVSKAFFEQNFRVLSGMYGILKPLDRIGNYKLPIEVKGLYGFWGERILDEINKVESDYVVNLLPISYGKLIYGKNKGQQRIFGEKRDFKIINVNFLKPDGSRLTHGVKKIKGEWVKNICEKKVSDYRDFGGTIVRNANNTIDVNMTVD